MDQSTMEELSSVKIVEADSQKKFRKKGSAAIKMTGPTFAQFLYNKKGGLFNHRLHKYNAIKEEMEEIATDIEMNPEEADYARYYELEEKLAKIGAKILWVEEKENFIKRESKKLKVPSILIHAIAPFRNFFSKKKHLNLYKKKIELASDQALKKVIEEGKSGLNIPEAEDLSLNEILANKTLEENLRKIKPEDLSEAGIEAKPLSLNEVLANKTLEENLRKIKPGDLSEAGIEAKPLSLNEVLANKTLEENLRKIKPEDLIEAGIEEYFKNISTYNEKDFKDKLASIEHLAQTHNFNIEDYIKINFKDYVKDFVLNSNYKKPSDKEIELFNRYGEIADKYHINFIKTREDIYKEEEERLLKLKKEQETKGQVNPLEKEPKNLEGTKMKYEPFDWSKYKKKEAPVKEEKEIEKEEEDLEDKYKPFDFSNYKKATSKENEENNVLHNAGNYKYQQPVKEEQEEIKEAVKEVNVDKLYKEYNPDITYDYNFGIINDDLRNLTEEELKKEEKKINEAFLSYVLLKHGKAPRELLNNIQEYVEETNKQRKEYNAELETNGRDLNKKQLPLLEKVDEIPQDYYLHSIYSNEFFKDNPEQFERTEKLANEVMRRIEEERKTKQEELAKIKEQEKIKTGRLVLKYGIGGYYALPDTKLTDKEVLEVVKLLENQNIYKDAMKRAGMKVREIKKERMVKETSEDDFSKVLEEIKNKLR